jgi:hypothetical protein
MTDPFPPKDQDDENLPTWFMWLVKGVPHVNVGVLLGLIFITWDFVVNGTQP